MLNTKSTGGWEIAAEELWGRGLRSPQGFSYYLDNNYKGKFWTTNEFAAKLFYRRYGLASPEVKESLNFDREQKLFELSSAIDSDAEFASPIGTQYMPYQKAAIEYCLLTANTLIADQQRLGKTIITLGVMNNFGDVRRTLIVSPKTAKPVWEAEAEKWLIENKRIQVLDPTSKLDDSANVVIANYDILGRFDFTKTDWDILVGDEIHTCKNNDAKRTILFNQIKARKKLGLSGTLMFNQPEDLLTVAQWIDPFWKSFFYKRGFFLSSTGITLTLEEMQQELRSSCMVRRLQSQVFNAEPPIRRIIPLAVPKDLEPFVSVEINGYKNLTTLSEYTNARLVLGKSKLKYALMHIDAYANADNKLVVFAWSREVIDMLKMSLGDRAEVVYGDTSDKNRVTARDRFRNDPTCHVIIGSIQAMGMAISLANASHILFVETDWPGGAMQQAEERCADREQTNQILIEYLAYKGSLDEYMLKNISSKENMAARGLDV